MGNGEMGFVFSSKNMCPIWYFIQQSETFFRIYK